MGSLWAARGEMGMLSLTCGRWDASTLGLPDQGWKIVSHLGDDISPDWKVELSCYLLGLYKNRSETD